MRTIINIARNELRQLFCSPIAWVLLIVFFYLAGSQHADILMRLTRSIATGSVHTGGLTRYTFLMPNGGLFTKMVEYIYLFIPLVAMGMISSEKSSGSNKLLLSSPITLTQVVLGKFVSMMAYCSLLMCSMLIPAVFTAMMVENFNVSAVLVGFLGIYLLMLAYSAVTIFMSSLTRYQIVAAVGTIATLFLMNYSRKIWQDVPFLRDITYWLGMRGRTGNFILGLFSSQDFIYFISIISMFLIMTVLVMQSSSRKEPILRHTIRFTAVILITLMVGYVSSRPKLIFYHDATWTKTNSLSDESQKVMAMLDGPLTITTYTNLLDPYVGYGLPKRYNYDVVYFEKYRRFKPEIKLEYVLYYNSVAIESDDMDLEEERAREIAEANKTRFRIWKSPEEIDKVIDLSNENYRFLRYAKRGEGSASVLRIYNESSNPLPSETEISAALKRLVVKPPKVGFLTGNGERSIASIADAGYSSFASNKYYRYALINQGFDVDTVSLYDGRTIPDDIDILVISEPRNEIPEDQMAKIGSYIDAGGNLLMMSKPRRSAYIEPLLSRIGVELIPGILVQQHTERTANVIVGDITPLCAEISRMYRPAAAKGFKIVGKGVSGIIYDGTGGFEMYPMITTDSLMTDSTRVWNELETTDFENETPVFNPENGERSLDRVPIIVGLERMVADKLQRIVVMGDSDIISNSGFLTSYQNVMAFNYYAVLGTFSWMTYNEFPVDTSRKIGPDNQTRYIVYKDRRWYNPLFKWVIPGIIALLGTILLIKRKGR